MEQRLSIITLTVDDLARARAFYEALGWRVASETAASEIVCFTLNGIGLALYPRQRFREEMGIGDLSCEADGGVVLAFNVRSRDEVAKTLDEAVEAGGTLMKAAADVFWGGYSGHFRDPEGHIWEVAWNPFSPLDESGSFSWSAT